MKLWTDSIDSHGFFDPRYTCDVDNSSPELRWAEPPEGTEAFVLIAEDLDGQKGVFAHWLVYNIPKEVLHLPAGIPPQDTLPNGIRQGLNGYGKLGYAGPCPPLGGTVHRSVFRVFALKQAIDLPTRLTRDQLLERIHPLVLGTTQIEGKYRRVIERAG